MATQDIEQYRNELRRFAMKKVRDPNDADDLVQESFRRFHVYVSDGKEIESVRGYLFTILKNVYTDTLSHQKREPTISLDQVVHMPAEQPLQFARLEMRDLSRALSRLPNHQRIVVVLVGVEGCSYQDAADKLGIPIGTVMSRLSRGRASLKRLMEGTEAGSCRRRIG